MFPFRRKTKKTVQLHSYKTMHYVHVLIYNIMLIITTTIIKRNNIPNKPKNFPTPTSFFLSIIKL